MNKFTRLLATTIFTTTFGWNEIHPRPYIAIYRNEEETLTTYYRYNQVLTNDGIKSINAYAIDYLEGDLRQPFWREYTVINITNNLSGTYTDLTIKSDLELYIEYENGWEYQYNTTYSIKVQFYPNNDNLKNINLNNNNVETVFSYIQSDFEENYDYDIASGNTGNIKTFYDALGNLPQQTIHYGDTLSIIIGTYVKPNIDLDYEEGQRYNILDLNRDRFFIDFNMRTENTILEPTQEVIDIPGVLLQILVMPFTFMSTAFNFTFWQGTPYAINIGHLLLGLLIALIIIFIIRKIIKWS